MERVEDLVPYARNAKKHTEEQVRQIANSIRKFGFADPVGIWSNADGEHEIVEGHGRVLAAQKLGMDEVPVICLDALTDEERRAYMLAHNQLTMNTGWNWEALDSELDELAEGLDMGDFGFDEILSSLSSASGHFRLRGKTGVLCERFGEPPFSVLDARSGRWQERKKAWRELVQDDNNRGSACLFHLCPDRSPSTSETDPVMCELACRWFAPHPKGDKCFDVFAGDPGFGVVAGSLGHEFTGLEIRDEQTAFNNSRFAELGVNARTICDDGRNVLDHLAPCSHDLLFSCPPYYDLEVYSDLPGDASNQNSYEEFYDILDIAFTKATQVLKDNRFAFIVTGDMRDARGVFHDFRGDVIRTFSRAGMAFYNEMVLVTVVGSAQLRANLSMRGRKVVKTHQDVLVFYKGDPRSVKDEFPEIAIAGCEDAE